ncbi:MAG: DUF2177 family protein [Actinomycetaceae bacterium]|nr:DUF2177 family protein [Actinomycetaceae bacterium]
MSTKRWLTALAGTGITFTAVDAVWISQVAQDIYRTQIPHLMGKGFSAAPALIFYGTYLAGSVHLAVKPGEAGRTWKERARDGAVLGALAYGAWGFTGAAVLDRFPLSVALSDFAWGAALTSASAVVGGLAMDRFAPREVD